MDQQLLKIITDFYKDLPRQGPGSTRATKWALTRIMEMGPIEHILDIGCGTGAQTIVLGQETGAQVEALDRVQDFLDVLKIKRDQQRLSDRIQLHHAQMDKLPFEAESFDLIWSEGAIYNMGFTYGLKNWGKLLKPGGFMVVSEISWTTESRPQLLTDYWNSNYPEMDLVSAKVRLMEMMGYSTIGAFALPDVGWRNYYEPVSQKLAQLDGSGSPALQGFLEQIKTELNIYNEYRQYYNYFFYIMRRP